jgi:hypothetical protein
MVNRLVARTRKGWRPNYEGADRPAQKLAKSIELNPEPEDSGEISEERRSILAKIDELMEKLAAEEAKTPPPRYRQEAADHPLAGRLKFIRCPTPD